MGAHAWREAKGPSVPERRLAAATPPTAALRLSLGWTTRIVPMSEVVLSRTTGKPGTGGSTVVLTAPFRPRGSYRIRSAALRRCVASASCKACSPTRAAGTRRLPGVAVRRTFRLSVGHSASARSTFLATLGQPAMTLSMFATRFRAAEVRARSVAMLARSADVACTARESHASEDAER